MGSLDYKQWELTSLTTIPHFIIHYGNLKQFNIYITIVQHGLNVMYLYVSYCYAQYPTERSLLRQNGAT
jgi:hypothetical protein